MRSMAAICVSPQLCLPLFTPYCFCLLHIHCPPRHNLGIGKASPTSLEAFCKQVMPATLMEEGGKQTVLESHSPWGPVTKFLKTFLPSVFTEFLFNRRLEWSYAVQTYGCWVTTASKRSSKALPFSASGGDGEPSPWEEECKCLSVHCEQIPSAFSCSFIELDGG